MLPDPKKNHDDVGWWPEDAGAPSRERLDIGCIAAGNPSPGRVFVAMTPVN